MQPVSTVLASGIFCLKMLSSSRSKKSKVKYHVGCSSYFFPFKMTMIKLRVLLTLLIVIICSGHYGPSLLSLSDGGYEAKQQAMWEEHIKFSVRGKDTSMIVTGSQMITWNVQDLGSGDTDSFLSRIIFRHVWDVSGILTDWYYV